MHGLVARAERVEGVRCDNDSGADVNAADLVIDAAGRGSHAPRWLAQMGYQVPPETSIRVDFAYSSAKFRVPSDYDRSELLVAFTGPPPGGTNGAIMEIIEDNTWHVTLAGRFGDYPPNDEAGFLGFAKGLHTTRLYDLIKDAERVSDIISYRFPSSVRRHYERLPEFPEGFVILGDAIASFNPFYGQGMSSAALQVRALQQLLAERSVQGDGLKRLGAAFFPKAAEAVADAWTWAANFDLAFPQTVGERPHDFKEALAYFAAVDALTTYDAEVQRLLVEVAGLSKPLSALKAEPLFSRVLAKMRKHPARHNF